MQHAAVLPDAAAVAADVAAVRSPPIPAYLQRVYWWAYVHPRAVRLFERKWLVSAILFGHYARLRDAAAGELRGHAAGRTLQIACVYGDLTDRLRLNLAPEGLLDIVDVLPVQLDNLAAKLPTDRRVSLRHADSSKLPYPDAAFDQALLFFLLHEQPPAVRAASLAEAFRVVRPGGKIVIIDYGLPRWWHPVRPLMAVVFRLLEPWAADLCRNGIEAALPCVPRPGAVSRSTCFGGLYRKVVIAR